MVELKEELSRGINEKVAQATSPISESLKGVEKPLQEACDTINEALGGPKGEAKKNESQAKSETVPTANEPVKTTLESPVSRRRAVNNMANLAATGVGLAFGARLAKNIGEVLTQEPVGNQPTKAPEKKLTRRQFFKAAGAAAAGAALVGCATPTAVGVTPNIPKTPDNPVAPTTAPTVEAPPAQKEEVKAEVLSKDIFATIVGTKEVKDIRLTQDVFSTANKDVAQAAGVKLLTVKDSDGKEAQHVLQYLGDQNQIIAQAPRALPKINGQDTEFNETDQVINFFQEGKITTYAVPYHNFVDGTYTFLGSRADQPVVIHTDGNYKVLYTESFWKEMPPGATRVTFNINPVEQERGGKADARTYYYREDGSILGVSPNIFINVPGGGPLGTGGGGLIPRETLTPSDVVRVRTSGVDIVGFPPEVVSANETERQKAIESLVRIKGINTNGAQVFEVASKDKDGKLVVGRYATTAVTEGPQQFWLWAEGQWQKVTQPAGIGAVPMYDSDKKSLVIWQEGKMTLLWDVKVANWVSALPTPTPKPTETPKPTATPEAPFFKDRTEGRKTGEVVSSDGKNSAKRIDDPDSDRWGGAIHPTISGVTPLFGVDIISGRSARIITIDSATKTVEFYLGGGQTIKKTITPTTHLIMEERVSQRGRRSDTFYHDGGNTSDLEEGDLVSLLVNPTNPKDEFWGLHFIQ